MPESTRRYSRAFEKLVTDDDDVVGLMAYALYKQLKREWRRSPEGAQGDAAQFESAYLLERSILDLRNKAQIVLLAYADVQIEAAREGILANAISEEAINARNEVRRAGGFWRQVLAGFATSILTTGALIILAVALALFGVDLLGGVETVRDLSAPEAASP